MDPEDFIDLINAHQAGLYRYVKFLGSAPHESKSIVHDVFVRAYYELPDTDTVKGESVFTILRIYARELYIEHSETGFFRKSKVDPKNLNALEDYWRRNITCSEDYSSRLISLEGGIQGLSSTDRKLLNKHYAEKFDQDWVAGYEMKEPSAVKRIRLALTKRLETPRRGSPDTEDAYRKLSLRVKK